VRVIETIAELQKLADRERASGTTIALVPTMGALHAGHRSLVEQARKRADRVWVSIFVNPTQFDDASDWSGYPRQLDDDLERCRDAGVDVVFAPAPDEMYPEESPTWVEVGEAAEPLCGRSRPGHFRGVATIVAKLLLAAKPHYAVFGEKDFQQLVVIRRMVRDLGFDVKIVVGAIVREPDGLAHSSRNARLHPQARRQATALVRALDAAQTALEAGERDADRLLEVVTTEIAKVPLARIDYAELCDPITLEPAPARLRDSTLLALAAFFEPPAGAGGDAVRLIDNRVLQLSADSARANSARD
jgi:pantoate--beta-alanine ligase